MPPAPPPIHDASATAARPRRRLPWGAAVLVAALAIFAAGVVHLFELRFDVGDVYPAYSTLRSDPLGAKALFASFEGLPGIRAERSLRPLSALGTEPLRPADYDNGEKAFTCFVLGEDPQQWPFSLEPAAVTRLETIMQRGGRVVMTFRPTTVPPSLENLARGRSAQADPEPGAGRHDRPSAKQIARNSRPPDLILRWGIDFRRHRAKSTSDLFGTAPDAPTPAGPPSPAAEAGELATPDPAATARGGAAAAFAVGNEAVRWRTVVDFRRDTVAALANRWHALYDRRGQPVIVARPFGAAGGELILVSDTYFLSNEGLRNDPSPAVLAALVGSGRRVIFDESHLGIREQPGLVALARRYRLQGAFATLILLAALFVWRNVVSLVPVRAGAGAPEAGESDTIAGHSAGSGYLNLLRRSVRPRDLPAVCLAQWETGAAGARKSGGGSWQHAGTPPSAGDAIERVRAVLAGEAARPARKRSPAAAVYRAMCLAVRRKA